MKKSNLGYVLVLIAALMWGSIGIFVNGISAMGVSSQSMAAFRLLVGALILAPVLMFMGCRPGEGSTVAQGPLALFKASPKELVPCALVGIVGLAAANTCYYECMGEVGMSTASVLLYTSPVFGVVLGRVLYREDVAAIAAPWPDVAAAMSPQLLLLFLGFGLIPTAVAYILYMQGLSMGLETSKVPVVMSFETVVTVLVGIGVYAEPAGAIKVLGIVLVLASILIMNTDFSKLRNSVFVGHVVESMTFKPNAWWTEKSQDMDLFKERTGIALEPTVQESPWYFVR